MPLRNHALDTPGDALPGILACRTGSGCETRVGCRCVGWCAAAVMVGVDTWVDGVGDAGAVRAVGAFGGVLGARGESGVVVVASHFCCYVNRSVSWVAGVLRVVFVRNAGENWEVCIGRRIDVIVFGWQAGRGRRAE
jgi:hypothetical protein